MTKWMEHALDCGIDQLEMSLCECCLRPPGRLLAGGQLFNTVQQSPGFVAIPEVQCYDREMRSQIDCFIDELGVHQCVELLASHGDRMTAETGVVEPFGQFAVQPG
ncbi:hypothetical protein SZN_05602 [Streptomyces zinciresistens K42]|uniref:Uncharacterized protein n=1 Tax=Streptomyces zinciresistens K42 TaxID=700597 RepID=G2G6L3_9ACTN|nr:hypothetical protein SZN_05602 [Streptomyces zinciresistens K42]